MTYQSLVKYLLFDLDGTLLDTAADLHAALNRALIDEGRTPVALERVRPWVSNGAPGMVRLALEVAESDPMYQRVLDRMIEYYADALSVQTVLFDGMESVLEAIESRGLYWGIVTNKRSRFSVPLLKSLNLFDRAACLICGDSTPHKKPHPEPLLEACRRIGAQTAECLYIGDAEKDILAGRRAGMTTLVAGYGYLDAKDDVRTWGAHGILQNPRDILQWMA